MFAIIDWPTWFREVEVDPATLLLASQQAGEQSEEQ
jgi:hypothetical protein